ncbi:MAG: hypothetical protein R3F02_15035 [Thiolinea sp.]
MQQDKLKGLKDLVEKVLRFFSFIEIFTYASVVMIIVVLLSTAMFVAVNFMFSNDKGLQLDKFYIPEQLEKIGYSEGVFVRQVIDEIHNIRSVAKSYGILFNETELTADFDGFDVPVPGAGLSVSTIVNFLEEFFDTKPKSISGELIYFDSKSNILSPGDNNVDSSLNKTVYSGDIFILTIRSQDVSSEVVQGTINELVQSSAQFVMKNLEPVVLALYYQSRKEYDSLKEVIHYVEQTQPENFIAISYILQSYLSYSSGDMGNAIYFANKSLQEKHDDLFALSNAAYLEYKSDNLERALSLYYKMIDIAPGKYVTMYAFVAQILLKKNQNAEAEEIINQAFRINKQYAVLYILKGELLRRAGNFDDALQQFLLAMKIRENIIDADKFFSESYAKLLDDLARNK